MSLTPAARSHPGYDAFLSYSHAADGRLAPALQHAVQRFATPWYRLRSLRLFRDQTGLAASPDLWTSIETALAQADWFVLFASPDAAASCWVRREIDWWLTHRDKRRLLIVVTDGTFAWYGTEGAAGSAVPDLLAAALLEEPRWIDMRWARHADQVASRDPRFREAVADLAATLRELPKDSLIGDDVRQHRRGRRLAISAVALVTALALVVAGLTIVSLQQQAATETARTEQAAQGMLVEAEAVRDRDPVAALQLGAAAHRLTPGSRTEADLVQSLTTPFRAGLTGHTSTITDIAWAPDGSRVATADGAGRVLVHRLVNRDTAKPDGALIEFGHPVERIAFTADGTRLAVAAAGRVEIVDPAEGRRLAGAAISGPAGLLAAGPAGSVLVVAGEQLLRWDQAGTPSVEPLPGAGAAAEAVLSADGRLLATASTVGVRLWDVVGPARQLAELAGPVPDAARLAFDPDASRLFVAAVDGTVTPWDLNDPGAPRPLPAAAQVVERTLTAMAVSHRGTQATASIDGTVVLASGTERLELGAHRTAPQALAFSPDGSWLLSGALDGELVLWDSGPGRGPVLGTVDPGHDGALITMAVSGATGGPVATGGNDGVLLWDVPAPGRLVRRPGRIEVGGAVLALAFARDQHTLAVGTVSGQVTVWDVSAPGGPQRLRELALRGPVFDLEFFADGATLIAAGDELGVQLVATGTDMVSGLPDTGPTRAVALSPDDRRLVVSDTFANELVLWDVADRARPVVAGRSPNGQQTTQVEAMAFTPSGALLISAGRGGKLVLSALDEPNRAQRVGEIRTAQRAQTRADAAALLTLAVSADGRTLVAAGEEGPIGMWDIADPSRPRPIGAPLQELRGQVYGVGLLPDGRTLVAGGQDERIAAWDLTPVEDLRRTAIDTACHRAGGPLTPAAWARLAPELLYRDTCAS